MRRYVRCAVAACLLLNAAIALAQPAPDANSVLILGSSVSGGAGSLEGTLATAQGFTVVVDSDAAWSARTTADFATFKALIIGDPTCSAIGPYNPAAEGTNLVWGPAVTGNIVIIGSDPTFHQSQGGSTVADSGIAFAAADANDTGLYITLSCYYHNTAAFTPVPVLAPFGAFTVTGVGCYNDAHIVAVHPALVGLTDASLSNWNCSVHEAFDSFPNVGPTAFLPLVIAENIGGPGSLTFNDGTFGIPYILARGEIITPVGCGNGTVEPPEECDDGNTLNGDGCSAQCLIENCGDGNVQPPEECDPPGSSCGSPLGAFVCSGDCLDCVPTAATTTTTPVPTTTTTTTASTTTTTICSPTPENTTTACNDRLDNDCDGLIDCVDPDCLGIPPCVIRNDPSDIRFGLELDRLRVKGTLDTGPVNLTETTLLLLLSDPHGELFKTTLSGDLLTGPPNGRILRYSNRGARVGGGIYKLKIRTQRNGSGYSFSTESYADLSAATDARLRAQFHIGDQAFISADVPWKRIPTGWRAPKDH